MKKDITDPASFSPFTGIEKTSALEQGAIGIATGSMTTAPPNAINEAAQSIQKEMMAADTEKSKIQEGNAHLSDIENNTQQTNEEIRKLRAAVEVLIGVMSGGSTSRISSENSNTRIDTGAPPNYYQANLSPNNAAGMGGTIKT